MITNNYNDDTIYLRKPEKSRRYLVIDGHFNRWKPSDNLNYNPEYDRLETDHVCTDQPGRVKLTLLSTEPTKMPNTFIRDNSGWRYQPFIKIDDQGYSSVLTMILIILNDKETIIREGCIHTFLDVDTIKDCIHKLDKLC